MKNSGIAEHHKTVIGDDCEKGNVGDRPHPRIAHPKPRSTHVRLLCSPVVKEGRKTASRSSSGRRVRVPDRSSVAGVDERVGIDASSLRVHDGQINEATPNSHALGTRLRPVKRSLPTPQLLDQFRGFYNHQRRRCPDVRIVDVDHQHRATRAPLRVLSNPARTPLTEGAERAPRRSGS